MTYENNFTEIIGTSTNKYILTYSTKTRTPVINLLVDLKLDMQS